jgi:hypothetical protein
MPLSETTVMAASTADAVLHEAIDYWEPNLAYWWLMVVIGASALLLPLLMLQYVPTQDGPAHLGTAALLLDLDRGTGSTVQALYQPAWKFSTNQIYQFALVTLGHWMPLPVAERILLMAMVLLVPFGVATAQRMLDGGDRPPWAAILALPAVTLPVFDLGFLNFFLGLLAAVVAVAAALRVLRNSGAAGAAGLAILLCAAFLVHILAAAFACMAIATICVVHFLKDWSGGFSQPWRAPAVVAVALVPVSVLVLAFIAQPTPTADSYGMTAGGSIIKHIYWGIPFLVAPLNGLVRVMRAMASLTLLELPFRVPWVLLLLGGMAAATVRVAVASRDRRDPDRPGDMITLGAAAWMFAAVPVLAPLGIETINFVVERSSAFAFLLAALWVGTALGRRAAAMLAGIALLLTVGLVGVRLPVQAGLSRQAGDLVTATAQVEPGSTYLMVGLSRRLPDSPLRSSVVLPSLMADPTVHLDNHMILRGAVPLLHYQAGLPYFPLAYRPENDPRPYLLANAPNLSAPDSFTEATGCRLDYVVMWRTAKVPEWLPARFEPADAPHGGYQLFRRRPDSPVPANPPRGACR